MPDGSPNWSLPANEPDNSPRAVAGRVLALAAVYAGGLVFSGAGLWAINQPAVPGATAGVILAMPGPGVVWQTAEAVIALTAAAGVAARRVIALRRRSNGSPATVTVDFPASTPDLTIPAGQLVYRRFDSPALATPAARPALRDGGSVEIETLLFRAAPPFLLLVALFNATVGSAHLRPTVWPLLAGALLLAWLGRHLRTGRAEVRTTGDPAGDTPAEVPVCESCEHAPGTVTVAFLDGATFHICALCLISGTHLALHPYPGDGASLPRDVGK